MSDEIFINLRCLFCEGTDFEIPEGYQPKEGDIIKCANCGRENPYDLLMEACAEEAQGVAKEILTKELKKAFAGNDHIKFK